MIRTETNGQNDPPRVRCAIYTRKSTTEGLEQEFNSLDAQREAAEAYVASQKHQGWVCLPDRYDDGGVSGATLDRPALKRLLEDIKAEKLDCVVVYKVDRLSRSLLDFTRLVDVLDRHGVTFVSITQQFQTTTSMGRLTLNVLLSFAQFEREMIADRTRDKMGAARRKGKWVGGFLILGYDLDPAGSRLLVNENEAERVRTIFDLYLKRRSLDQVVRELARRNWTTKSWTTRKGIIRGGKGISKSTLSHLLQQPYYIGEVHYRGEVYAGEHESIVDQAVFDEVQACLKRAAGKPRPRQPSRALLQGLLRCARCDAPMTPTYTSKRARRYRYYACTREPREGPGVCAAPRLARCRVDRAVLDQIRLFARGEDVEGAAGAVARVRARCRVLDATWDTLSADERREALRTVLQSAAYDGAQGVLHLSLAVNEKRDAGSADEASAITLTCALRTRNEAREASATTARRGAIPRVARLMALALRFERLLSCGAVKDYAELARRGHVTRPRITQVMDLLHLAPDLQERVLFLAPVTRGRARVTERKLRPVTACVNWPEQRAVWGRLFSDASS